MFCSPVRGSDMLRLESKVRSEIFYSVSVFLFGDSGIFARAIWVYKLGTRTMVP